MSDSWEVLGGEMGMEDVCGAAMEGGGGWVVYTKTTSSLVFPSATWGLDRAVVTGSFFTQAPLWVM